MNAESIQHVDNLDTFAKLESLGFDGPDADLETALREYGLAWNECDDGILFIYGARCDDAGEWIAFDRCIMASDENVRDSYSWADFDGVCVFVGMDAGEWDKLPLVCKIQDLAHYYGMNEIFGASYWEGFAIN